MARTRKRGEAPAGTLGADDLQRWLEEARSDLGAAGISAHFGRAPKTGGKAGSTWVSMTSPSAHGRLVRAADGSTTVTARSLPHSTPLLDESHPHTTPAQLEAMVAALGAAPPTAGRA